MWWAENACAQKGSLPTLRPAEPRVSSNEGGKAGQNPRA